MGASTRSGRNITNSHRTSALGLLKKKPVLLRGFFRLLQGYLRLKGRPFCTECLRFLGVDFFQGFLEVLQLKELDCCKNIKKTLNTNKNNQQFDCPKSNKNSQINIITKQKKQRERRSFYVRFIILARNWGSASF